MNDQLPGSLDERLRQMPLDRAPERDLWPAIGARLQPQLPLRARAWPRIPPRGMRTLVWAAAAGIAGALIAGSLTWAVLHARPGAPALALEPQAVFQEPRDSEYVSARATLEVSFRKQLQQLDPATRTRIEASLAVIRQAHEEIRKALASDPASPVLEQLWQSTWRDELDLYDRVARGTQSTLTRT